MRCGRSADAADCDLGMSGHCAAIVSRSGHTEGKRASEELLSDDHEGGGVRAHKRKREPADAATTGCQLPAESSMGRGSEETGWALHNPQPASGAIAQDAGRGSSSCSSSATSSCADSDSVVAAAAASLHPVLRPYLMGAAAAEAGTPAAPAPAASRSGGGGGRRAPLGAVLCALTQLPLLQHAPMTLVLALAQGIVGAAQSPGPQRSWPAAAAAATRAEQQQHGPAPEAHRATATAAH